jgi:hypothetical protein
MGFISTRRCIILPAHCEQSAWRQDAVAEEAMLVERFRVGLCELGSECGGLEW